MTMTKRGHNEGAIDQRGPDRWRLRWRVADKRFSKTVRGPKKAAQMELRRLLESADRGVHVAPVRTSLAEYLRSWLASNSQITPKTRERYRQLAEHQIIPHLGATLLQNLRPTQILEWHQMLLREGGASGRPLSARTVGHAHRVLHRGLERAVRLELISRNVTRAVRAPKIEANEVAILSAEQITDVLFRLHGHPLYPIVAFALGTGMRRGEICGLAWGCIDLEAATVRVERSLEETAEGLRFKPPKTRPGRRTISVPTNVIEVLREHRRQQLQQRLLLGLGRPDSDEPVFTLPDGSPYPPDKLSRDWLRVVISRKLPHVMFHALRHSHVSALIAGGLDVVTVSQRIGHASPEVTLKVYAHRFVARDNSAAKVIEAAMRGKADL
jgi:integrase